MKKSRFVTYDKARDFSLKIRLKNVNEWREYAKSGKKPKDVPAWPYGYYLDNGWISWGDFLGTNGIATAKRRFRDFSDTRDFVRKLNLKNMSEWRAYVKSGKKLHDIPAWPREYYLDKGWEDWKDFLIQL